MPGIIIHTLLGNRILERWRDARAGAPFSIDDPGLRATFFSGCLGPDMGMYPGGSHLFSNLAHYIRSGELSRSLIREARNDAERAFAWGWTAHVLADVLIHPLINLAAGESRGCPPLTYVDNPSLHLAIETGADGCHFARWQQIGLPRFPVLPRAIGDCLGRAYRATYGSAVTEGAILASLAAWARWHEFVVELASAASSKLYGRTGDHHQRYRFRRLAVTFLASAFARNSPLYGLTHPLAPTVRVESLIDKVMSEFLDQYFNLQRDNLKSLPDYNLDTGEVEQSPTYPLAVKTLKELKAAMRTDEMPVKHGIY